MNAIIITLLYVAAIGLVWLVPLYFICKWAERQKKDHRIVGLVGILTGWLIALIVALLLPELSDDKLAAMNKKSEREPLGESSVLLGTLGICSVITLAFMAWMKWGI
jgi:hypothetical protein